MSISCCTGASGWISTRTGCGCSPMPRTGRRCWCGRISRWAAGSCWGRTRRVGRRWWPMPRRCRSRSGPERSCWRIPGRRAGLLEIWSLMRECVDNGVRETGVLPGGLKVRRRAHTLHEQLMDAGESADPLHAMEWITLFALAVNEENAAGGRVVTAPTNGAAGIVPAVLHYWTRFVAGPSAAEQADGVVRFLLPAAAIGILFKEGASISGAEVGCQGEVGSACSMAAGGLA